MTGKVRVTAERWLESGNASSYIHHAPEFLRPGQRVLICCRVSEREQERAGNLANSEANLCRAAVQLGAIPVGCFGHVGSGFDPWWVYRAAKEAAKLGAVLLAETTDRFIRHPGYHSQECPNAQARESDLRALAEAAGLVPLVTHLHPDAPPAAVRAYQRKRGQWAKGNRGGRPAARRAGDKRRARALGQAKVRWLVGLGLSRRDTAKQTGIPLSNVMRWARHFYK